MYTNLELKLPGQKVNSRLVFLHKIFRKIYLCDNSLTNGRLLLANSTQA